MEQFLQVGVISSTHGLRGEVKVFRQRMMLRVFRH